MASLKYIEKQLFEKLFDRGGYVLEFSNYSFEEFFKDFNISILSEKYNIKYSGSKMNRLRAFWELENDKLVGEVSSSLLELANSIEPIDEKDNIQAKIYINRLLGISEPIVESEEITEDKFLTKEFQNINLSSLNLGNQVEVISQRIEEIKKCLNSKAALSVIFLCGSTLEGVLLNLATQNPEKFNCSKSAPQKDGKVKKFHDWTLNDLINVSHEQFYIGLDIKKFSHSLRDFRNFIHPYQQMALQFNPDHHTAKISWQVLQATIAQLGGVR